ncbi:co-chaperone GroES [uncultured Sneathia sp.]|uniref:co-chaperone GroES n=1 Tax=Sneathia vaginalis TaxID=187101 RepID=UPI002595C40B|nr:co-chaperone GroES [uncultured Sneathia sp.]
MLKPMGDRVLVIQLDYETKTKSGIILNDTTKTEITKAKVVETNNDKENIKKDDIVYFSKYKGESIKYDEKEYMLVEIKDILAKEQK